MKIKSWNGVEVEAREQDVVEYDLTGQRNEISFFRSTCFFSDGAYTSSFAGYTLVHRPLLLNDEAEILDVQTGKWHPTKIDDEDLNMSKRHGSIFYDWLTKFRHANPALRDSPEYKT